MTESSPVSASLLRAKWPVDGVTAPYTGDGAFGTDAPAPIGEYAMLGDQSTAALVSRRGSVDWLCLPRFDSPACFAALLGTPEHGRWLLTVTDADTVERHYLGDSFALDTMYASQRGAVRVTEVMTRHHGHPILIRRLVGVRGRARIRHEWRVRFGYGSIRPWVHRVEDLGGEHAIQAVAGPDRAVMRASRLPHGAAGYHEDDFTVHAGQVLYFTMTWTPSWEDLGPAPYPEDLLADEIRRAHAWARRMPHEGPYAAEVRRSAGVLRLLTHRRTGGIVAAPTTSLPETLGGERNWDYRFTWLRDAALTLHALIDAGYAPESLAWREWLLRAVAGDPAEVQIMYGVDGSRHLPERELPHLPGYAASLPVRIGNGAVTQHQSDVLGEVMMALEAARHAGIRETQFSWALQRELTKELARTWRRPDRGIWEVRGPEREFTHSRVMVWVALDRAVRAVEEFGFDGPVETWKRTRDQVRRQVLRHGYNRQLGHFTQYYGSVHTDAALLQIPLTGFLDYQDPRVLATVEAIEQELMVDGLLLRYRTEYGTDGLAGTEHPFLACSFWLAEYYSRAGRLDDAAKLLDRLSGTSNDLGLFAEEYDPASQLLIGNFPQAFSHLAQVRAALAYREELARQEEAERAPHDSAVGAVGAGA